MGSVLLAIGVLIFAGDLLFALKYGADINDVAFVTSDGMIVDWPTGLRPPLAQVPAFVYAFALFIAAAAFFSVWPQVGKEGAGRVRRGTE